MILKWNQFIRESASEKKIWSLTKDEIEDMFYYIKDEGYSIDVEFGFNQVVKVVSGTKNTFTIDVKPYTEVIPAYLIKIISTPNVSDADVTQELKTAYNILSSDYKVELQDADGPIDINEFKIEGGLWAEAESLTYAEEYIGVFVIENRSTELTPVDMADYYKWTDISEKGKESIYIQISYEDLVELLIKKDSPFRKYLIHGMVDEFWDSYDTYYYRPDIDSLFKYHLNKENMGILVECLIKDEGGLDKFKSKFGITSNTKEDVINELINERFNSKLKEISKGSEIVNEIISTIADFEMQAHASENYNDIEKEFKRIVDKEISDYAEIKKDDKDFFCIPFDYEWIKYVDADELFNKSLFNIFYEYALDNMSGYTLDPHFSDYGSTDKNEVNAEIKSILKSYLKELQSSIIID